VIVNPAAGRRRRPFLEAVLGAVRARGVALTVRETAAPGHAETLARAAVAEQFDAILAAGGDGTVNEVINGLAGSAQVFGIVPLGTANVLAAEIGLACTPEAIAHTIAGGTPRPVYFARAGGRVFALMAGAGLDARVVAGVDLKLKRRVGKLAYVWQALLELIRYRPTLYEVALGGGARHRAAGVIVAKGHYYGGRFVCAPQARLGEPVLQVCLFQKPGRLSAMRYALALASGRLCRLPESDYRIVPARALTISGPPGERMQLDGDVGVAMPAAIEVIEEPFLLLTPPGPAGEGKE
jgi:YegS/Rv2252/BmrU family lipid kinase